MFATEVVSAKVKIVKRYRPADVKTPLAFLALLAGQGLVTFKVGVRLAKLQAQGGAQTDLAAAQ